MMPPFITRLRAKLFPAGSDAVAARAAQATVGADQVSPPAGKLLTLDQAKAAWEKRKTNPALKPPSLGKSQLAWCRKRLVYEGAPVFASMESAARSAGLIARGRK